MAVDDLDRHLIELLAEDGRRAHTEMAALCGVSEATVRARMQNLLSDGTLRIVALCNPLTLGHQPARILIDVRGVSPREVAKALVPLPAIGHVALVGGDHDIYLDATVRDVGQFAALLDDIRRTPGVATLTPLVLTRLFKDYSWNGLRGQSGERAVGGSFRE